MYAVFKLFIRLIRNNRSHTVMNRTLLNAVLIICLFECVKISEAVTEADCYMQECSISLATRDNVNGIMTNQSSVEGNLNASILAAEVAIRENATMEMRRMGTEMSEEISSCTAMLDNALQTAKTDILTDIESICPSSEFKVTDAQLILVELDVYSGVENPKWTVPSGSANFGPIITMLSSSSSSQITNKAGYRGFIVNVRMKSGAAIVYKFGAGRQATVETMLLNSNTALDGVLVSLVTAAINRQAPPNLGFTGPLQLYQPSDMNPNCGRRNPCFTPTYNPSEWSGLARISNNCFNYALNVATNTYDQPGFAEGTVTGLAVRNAVVDDRLIDYEDPAPGAFPDINNNCLIALMVMEGLDYHFLRQDVDGTWSHKVGTQLPSKLDNNGDAITDPRTANLGPYEFVRFLGVCPRKYGNQQ